MRKILLASTALVGFAVAGAAQAATSPLTVTIGGDVDVLAGAFHESKAAAVAADDGVRPTDGDFETLYSLNFGVAGKAGNGIEYGGHLVLDNYPNLANLIRPKFQRFVTGTDGVEVTTANVFVSGAFGKVVLGDSRGATDIALTTPTVGEGGVTGRYIDFLNPDTFAKTFVYGIDATDHSTNVTYFTPKVGNENNKVQLGISYVPQFLDSGNSVVLQQTGDYKNMIKGALAYTGTFKPVTVGLSGDVISAVAPSFSDVRDFTAWGLGAQAAAEGFTLGVNYLNLGHAYTEKGGVQTKEQQQFGAGLKYEFSKFGVGVSYLGGEGYDNLLEANGGTSYVKDFNSYGVGGSYTWAPGLTTNLDGVLFDQKLQTDGVKDDGYVLLVSQKLAF
jgi:hypothetical protein